MDAAGRGRRVTWPDPWLDHDKNAQCICQLQFGDGRERDAVAQGEARSSTS